MIYIRTDSEKIPFLNLFTAYSETALYTRFERPTSHELSRFLPHEIGVVFNCLVLIVRGNNETKPDFCGPPIEESFLRSIDLRSYGTVCSE